MRPFFSRSSILPAFALPVLTALVLAGCGGLPGTPSSSTYKQQESFNSTTTYSRSYGTDTARTCEGARRALLSQGYVISSAAADSVNGRKNFQPQLDMHVQVDLRVVCTSDGPHASLVFVNAVQDRYTIKKSASAASVGVPAFGSLSLPFASSDDSLVRVGSETVQDAGFYDRFFTLLERYLPAPWKEPSPGAMPASPSAAVSGVLGLSGDRPSTQAAQAPSASALPRNTPVQDAAR